MALGMSGKFIQLVVKKKAKPEDIDKFIQEWHEKESKAPIHIFLGLSLIEYTDWLMEPSSLDKIVKRAARRHRIRGFKIKKKLEKLERKTKRPIVRCSLCHGTGWVKDLSRTAFPGNRPCPNCEKGKLTKQKMRAAMERKRLQ